VTRECSGVCFSHSTEHSKEEYAEVLGYLCGVSGPQNGLEPFISTEDTMVSDHFVTVIQQLTLQEKPIPYENRPVLPRDHIMGRNSCRRVTLTAKEHPEQP